MANDSLKNIWPEWEVEDKPLGCGSYGVVYKAVRRDHDVVSYAAIKVISIPQSESQIDSIRSEGLSVRDTKTYLEGVVTDFVSEIRLMESFKGVQNIVSVEDYKVVEKEDGIGWDIYIRMELLTPFNKYSADRTLSEQEVIKLGIDMCTALELCAKRNVIHRDIKPENIFINEFGDFKLGDFGIARRLENATSGMSQKGTYPYMAPEVEKSTEYDARADICSLGIVLYRLMNKNRLPFCDLNKQILSPVEREAANRRRLDGEPLPTPCNASQGLSEVILCACAHDPEDRFATATAMKNALLSVANGSYRPSDRTVSILRADQAQNSNKTVSVRRSPESNNANEKSEEEPIATFGQDKQKRTKLSKGKKAGLITVAVLVVIIGLAIAGAITYLGGSAYKAVKSMNRGDYSEAIEMYSDSIKDDFIQSMLFEGLLEKQYNEKLDDYASGRLSYSETLDYIDAVLVFKVIDGADKKFSEIIISRSDAIIAEYKNGTLDYTKAKQELEALANKENSILKTTYANDKIALLTSLFSAASAYETAEQKMNSGNYVEAMAQLGQIPEDSDLYADAQQKLIEATTAYKASVLEQAEAYVQAENYTGAISVIEYALTIIPGDLELQKKLDEYQTSYHASVVSAALTESTALQSQGNYIDAINVLKEAIASIGEDSQLQTAYNTCLTSYKASILSEAEEMARNNDYLRAWEIINEAFSILGEDSDLTSKAEDYESAYVDDIVSRSNTLIEEDDYSAAMELIDEALVHFPSNEKLTSQMQIIEAATPKFFMEACTPYHFQSCEPLINGKTIKMSGVSYSNGIVQNYHAEGRFIANLDKRFTEMTFVVGHVDGTAMCDYTVEVYLDDVLMKTIQVKATGMPQSVKIVLENKRQLIVCWKTAHANSYQDGCQVGFADMYIKENPNYSPEDTTTEGNCFVEVCPPYQMSSAEIVKNGQVFYMAGYSYSNGIKQNYHAEGQFIANLEKKYNELSFTIGHIDGTAMCDYTVEVFLDGVLVNSIDVRATGLPQRVKISVQGKSQLMIVWQTAHHNSYQDGCGIGFGDMIIN